MSTNECDAIRPLISAALDGDLDEDEFVQLSEHLAACPACRQTHHEYMQIRDGFRTAQAPAPPPRIAKVVWQETVDKPPAPLLIRVASQAGIKFGMSTMAASIVMILVAVMFVAHGHNQRSIPTISSSSPAQHSSQTWPVSRPIEIEFDKQMNRASVVENLEIRPKSEEQRLPTSWSGNTLIIGRSEEQSVLLMPDTDYRITILESARDRHGNPLGELWILEFRTGPPDLAVATPAPYHEEDSEQYEAGAPSHEQGFAPGRSNPPSDDQDQAENGESEQAEPTETESDDQTLAEEPSGIEQEVESEGEETPSDGDQQAMVEQPTSTPAPEPTPTPKPDPTPEPTPTPKPETPETPEPIPVRGAFGEVYWAHSSVQQTLGAPTQEARIFLASEQEFQRGLMFRQHFDNRNAIYVFINDGPVQIYDNTFDASIHDFPMEARGDGLFTPGGFFGKIWRENSSLESQIGLAVSADPIRDIDAAIQRFERGVLIYSRGSVYLIDSSNGWQVFHVRSSSSSGGFQGSDSVDQESDSGDIEPTPEATVTEVAPTPTPEADLEPPSDDDSPEDES